MRVDEQGNECPSTLGEYRDVCALLGGEGCAAVAFLDQRIAEGSRDEEVLVSDAQMRALLMLKLAEDAGA